MDTENKLIEKNQHDEELIEIPVKTAMSQPIISKMQPISEELVVKAVGGDQKAFEDLFMLTYGYVYMLARKRLRYDNDIYDAIQDTYIKVYANLKRLKAPSAFISWLRAIVENCVTDILRSAALGTEEYAEYMSEEYEADPQDRFKADVSMDISEIMSRLPTEQTELLIRVYYDGMTVAEIARLQNVPKSTVYSRLKAAKKNLKAELEIRGIDKSVYGGSLTAMFATAVRNAIGTDLLSVAVAEEILQTVVNGQEKRKAVIDKITLQQRNAATIRLASMVLAVCVAVSVLTVALIFHFLSGNGLLLSDNSNVTASIESSSEETQAVSTSSETESLSENILSSSEYSSEEDVSAYESSLNQSSAEVSSDLTVSSVSSAVSSSAVSSSSASSSAVSSSAASSSSASSSSASSSSVSSSSVSSGVSSTEEYVFVSDYKAGEKNTNGITLQNLTIYRGSIAMQGDWLYYKDGSTLYKVKKDGSSKTTIASNVEYSYPYINVVGDWIYYINNNDKISKIRTDGKLHEELSDLKATQLQVIGDTGYFVNTVQDNFAGTVEYYYYKIDLTTKKTEKLQTLIRNLAYVWIYKDCYYYFTEDYSSRSSVTSFWCKNMKSGKVTLVKQNSGWEVNAYDDKLIVDRYMYDLDDMSAEPIELKVEGTYFYTSYKGGAVAGYITNPDYNEPLDEPSMLGYYLINDGTLHKGWPFKWGTNYSEENFGVFDDGYVYFIYQGNVHRQYPDGTGYEQLGK